MGSNQFYSKVTKVGIMKKYVAICLLLLLILAPNIGFCNANWVYAFSNDTNSVWYIDVNSISRNGGIYKSDGSYYLFTSSQRSTDNQSILEDTNIFRADVMWLVNDQDNTVQTVFYTLYGRRGEILSATTGGNAFVPMKPGSINAKLFDALLRIYNE